MKRLLKVVSRHIGTRDRPEVCGHQDRKAGVVVETTREPGCPAESVRKVLAVAVERIDLGEIAEVALKIPCEGTEESDR